tara:strand:- start:279 stop:512 length:234 start_codon:yes stop_codon:yes gene_type:complete
MDDLKQIAKNDLRSLRNSLLVESDKYLLPDFPISESKKEEWKTYRQALRELPETCPDVSYPEGGGELQNFTLPTKPE